MDDHQRNALRIQMLNRLRAVEERMTAACQRAGRDRRDVTLVAVTKTVSPEVATLITELGVCHLGENRPQELWRKGAALDASVQWHLIGHLQRNKVERTLPLTHLIHSVDSVRLLNEMEGVAARQGRMVDVLLEVNVSGEANKHGFQPEEVPQLVPQIHRLRNVRVQGLMTMAAFEEDPERTRPTFASLRQLRDRLRTELGPAHPLERLSMGMSNDFEVAIEEGATLVRIGSALFEGLVEGDQSQESGGRGQESKDKRQGSGDQT
jgi:pyridoxal phosphate enzyme (YggS family)